MRAGLEAAGLASCGNGGIPISQPSRSPTRMHASPGPCCQTAKPTIPASRLDRPEDAGTSRQRSQGGPTKPLQRSAEMVKAVTPSLPEPGVWTGMASANVLAPLRWKRAKTHRGSRHRHMPHQEAGYTSAAVALDPQHAEHRCNRAGSIYVHTWHNSDLPPCPPLRHSSCVRPTSRMKPRRCFTSESITARKRGSGAPAIFSSTRSVSSCSVT